MSSVNTTRDKDLKTRARYTSSFDIELLQSMKDLSNETMIPLSKLFDKAIELLLKEYGKEINKD